MTTTLREIRKEFKKRDWEKKHPGDMWVDDKWILDKNGKPRKTHSLRTWGKWFETAKSRIVARTKVGKYEVSTVFLAMDYRFSIVRKGKPVLWESMVFRKMSKREVDKRNKEMRVSMRYMAKKYPKITGVKKLPDFYKYGQTTEADLPMARYSSLASAKRGHAKLVKLAKVKLKK